MNELIILDYRLMLPYHIYNYGYCCSFFFFAFAEHVFGIVVAGFIHSLTAFVAFAVIIIVDGVCVCIFFLLHVVAVSLVNFIVVGIVCVISY